MRNKVSDMRNMTTSRVETGGARSTGTRSNIAAALVMIVLLTSLQLLLYPFTVSAHTVITTANTGHIYGQLLDGTKKNAPVVGQSVTLQMAQGNNASDLTKITTDAHGMYSFTGLNTDKTINYAVYTLYQGAQYYTDLIDLSSKPEQQINMTVYEATISIAKIAIVQANILIDKTDAQNGLLHISESFFFENLGSTTYVGSLHANGSKPNALRFSLPANARQLSLNTGFDGYQVIQVDPGFATDAAIPPGTSQFAFSFQVPYVASAYDFSYTIVYPTVDLSLLLPLDIHASSSGLTSQGPKTANQRTYQLFEGKTLLVNDQIHVELEGLPAAKTATPSAPVNSNTLWLIAGLLVMLGIITVTLLLYRAARSQGQVRVRQKQHTTTTQQRTRDLAIGRGETLGDKQQALLQELLDLDTAYEAGTLKKAAYQERRAKIKARLRTIMSAEPVEKTSRGKGAS